MKRGKVKKSLRTAVIVLSLFLLQGCGVEKNVCCAKDSTEEISADEILAGMSLEQKIYQMFIVTPEALTGYDRVTTAGEVTRSKLAEYPVGGLIYFSKNLVSRTQTVEMLDNTQKFSMNIEGFPLFLCVDEEGGRVARIGNNTGFAVPKIQPMQNIASREEAYEAGNTIGSYLKEMGFNLDFAPDADVLTNGKNTVIGNRSFGFDPETVLLYADAYSEGLHANGILSTFKHFPGHGSTEADTHEGFAYTNKTYEELSASELVPFAGAGESGIDFVMVSHISVPNVTGDNTPCSLSHEMVTGILRGDMGYQGIIITDAMNMGAVVEKYSCAQAAVLAVKAGADMVLMPEDFEAAVDGLLTAVDSGEISEERIDESVGRIIGVKLQMQ